MSDVEGCRRKIMPCICKVVTDYIEGYNCDLLLSEGFFTKDVAQI